MSFFDWCGRSLIRRELSPTSKIAIELADIIINRVGPVYVEGISFSFSEDSCSILFHNFTNGITDIFKALLNKQAYGAAFDYDMVLKYHKINDSQAELIRQSGHLEGSCYTIAFYLIKIDRQALAEIEKIVRNPYGKISLDRVSISKKGISGYCKPKT